MRPFAADRTSRSARHEKHPVRDFLFEYYSFRRAHLLRWSPGVNVVLENARPGDIEWKEFTQVDDSLVLPAESFPARRRPFVRWALNYLEGIAARPPQFGCFGLHEWAMVYRTPEVRHSRTPLRLDSEAIASAVEAEELCCTHFDAYRFFTPAAVPRNRHRLSREATDRFDQRGCIHVTMDLYRYAYKIAPWVDGELIADAFELAWTARELDMRASPYDLAGYNLAPIRIETREGKDEYIRYQRQIADAAVPVRDRLIRAYRDLICGSN
ncbi:MAG: 3-methyladenine DNA glycosylase [Zavarzinella sp.]|nr:3-methyladenine DNA glycosylase [Zavarzinella sp.]